MCVRARGRAHERERERERDTFNLPVKTNLNFAM
jgi:hypothetical protein